MKAVSLRSAAPLLCAALVLGACTSTDREDNSDDPTASVSQPPGNEATRVILTPTATPDTSQSFTWLAGTSSETATLELQPIGGDADPIEVPAVGNGSVNGNAKQHFTATAEGLDPGRGYHYRVGAPEAWSEWSTFTTAEPERTDFTFLYFGDAQVGLDTTWPRVAAAASSASPQSAFSVLAGDLVNDGDNDAQWEAWTKGLGDLGTTRNAFTVVGNHEYLGDSLLQAWRSTLTLPQNGPSLDTIGSLADLADGEDEVALQYAAFFDRFTEIATEAVYVTDYQGVRFVALDGTRDQVALTPDDLPACADPACPASAPGDLWMRFQAAWLDEVLAESDATWNVVSVHQPIFSSTVGFDERFVRNRFLPVIEARGVDLVLMGHDHVYARGYTNSDATKTPGLTSGPVFVTSNAGSLHLPLETNPAKNVWTLNDATQVRTGQGVATYQKIDVTSTTMRYRSVVVEKLNSTTAPGEVFDEFTITRSSDDTTWVTEPGVAVPK